MKKRLLSFTLAVLVCASLSTTAFAASNSKSGSTSGGTSGSTTTSASLNVGTNTATAATYAGTSDGTTCKSSVIYYYLNQSNQNLSTSSANTGTGSSSTTAINSYNSGYKATSQHSVSGGTRWGSWSCSLSANAV